MKCKDDDPYDEKPLNFSEKVIGAVVLWMASITSFFSPLIDWASSIRRRKRSAVYNSNSRIAS